MNDTTTTPASEPRVLGIDGMLARQEHLVALLKHLSEFGTARAPSIAFALFPARTQTAALTAAKRCLSNAVKLGLVDFEAHPKSQHRFYALSRIGAAQLKKIDPGLRVVVSGTYLLRKTENGQKVVGLKKATHREWTTMLTVWGRMRKGLVTFNERQLLGSTGAHSTGITQRHFRAPDALTFDTVTDPEHPTVYWHEVELSRRSQWTPEHRLARRLFEEKTGAPAKTEGYESWIDLLTKLRTLRTVELENVPYDITLVVHCGTPQLKHALKTWTRKHFYESPAVKEKRYDLRDHGDYMAVNYANKKHHRPLSIIFADLPKLDDVWHDSPEFPFFNAGNLYELDEHAAMTGEQVMAKPGKVAGVKQRAVPVQENLFANVVPDSSYSIQFHHGKHVSELPDDGSLDEF